MKDDHTKLLDPKYMDGPIVHWTVADLLKSDKKTFMKYHVMESGYGALTPVGTILGGIVYGVGFRPSPSALKMMGTTGLVAGVAGMILGLTRMNKVASQGENVSPPWTDDGIQNRVDGLSHNFKVRILDLSVWGGMGLAAGALVLGGGPVKLGLSKGVGGILQALSLGTAVGSLSAFGCIYSTIAKVDKGNKDVDE
jgi:hypothetical protein